MIQATYRITVPRENRAEVLRAFRSLKGPTEVSRGCVACHILFDADDEEAVLYVERWEAQQDLDNQLRSGRYQKLLGLIESSTEPPLIEFSTISRVEGIEYLEAVPKPEV